LLLRYFLFRIESDGVFVNIKKKLRRQCLRLSAFLIIGWLQCYAYAGFAVNDSRAEPTAIYESETTLVPKSVSKDEAIQFYAEHQDKYTLVFAYDLSLGQALTLEDASADDAFAINPYTFKIGIASKSKDAVALTQSQPEVFYAVADESLSTTIARWAKEQGYALQWNSPNDFNLSVSHVFYGSFQQCLNDLLMSIAASSDGFAVKAVIMKNGVVMIKPNEYRAEPVMGV